MKKIIILFLLIRCIANSQEFGDRLDYGIVNDSRLNEISGIACSRLNPDIFWIHNDSGSDPVFFAINNKAELVAEITLKGANSIDWEDIAVGPGPKDGVNYIYIGDIGDNDAVYPNRVVYRFEEPKIIFSGKEVTHDTISVLDKISFVYPDGKKDCECLMVDPWTKDIILVSKRLTNEKVYKISYPQSTDITNTPELITTLPFGYEGFDGSGVTAGDISADGTEIIIKNYSGVYYYSRKSGESLNTSLNRTPVKLPYTFEPQGEGLCWDSKGSGYYTISEERFGIKAHLYFYPRKGSSVKEQDSGFLIKTGEGFSSFENLLSSLSEDYRVDIFNINGTRIESFTGGGIKGKAILRNRENGLVLFKIQNSNSMNIGKFLITE